MNNTNQHDHHPPVVVTVIHCWSAPRSRSTALLYSFEARGTDCCIALDEPLYREWLIQRGDAVTRPYTQELIHGVDDDDDNDNDDDDHQKTFTSWNREQKPFTQRLEEAARELVHKDATASPTNDATSTTTTQKEKVLFCKHMAKHCFLYDFSQEQTTTLTTTTATTTGSTTTIQLVHKHLLLIRDPVSVLSSWDVSSDVHQSDPKPDEVGIVQLLSIYSNIQSQAGDKTVVVVLDSDELVLDPIRALQHVCSHLHIPYTPAMMSWHSGPHHCDGPWAKWWYDNVHKSKGWKVKNKKIHDQQCNDDDANNNNNDDNEMTAIKKQRYRTMNKLLYPALQISYPAYQVLKTFTRPYQLHRGSRSLSSPSSSCDVVEEKNKQLLVWIGALQQTKEDTTNKRSGMTNHGKLIPRDLAGVTPWDTTILNNDPNKEHTHACSEELWIQHDHLYFTTTVPSGGTKSSSSSNNNHNNQESNHNRDDDTQFLHSLLQAAETHTLFSMPPPPRHQLKSMILESVFQTLATNNMRHDAHLRIVLTRGEQFTSVVQVPRSEGNDGNKSDPSNHNNHNGNNNRYGPNLIIVPEWVNSSDIPSSLLTMSTTTAAATTTNDDGDGDPSIHHNHHWYSIQIPKFDES